MLVGLFAVTILIMKLFPETAIVRSLHRWLVEWPLDMGERMERRHILMILILLCTGQSLVMLGGTELAIAYAADLSIYADALLLGYLASAAIRLRNGWWMVRSAATRLFARRSRPRSRPRRKKPAASRRAVPGNDDDPLWLPFARAA